jgi:hypothetical protein
MGILEYVFVGIRKLILSSEDEKLKERFSYCGSEWRCQTTVQRPGTFSSSRRVFSANMKSVSEKYLLHRA